MYNNKNSMCKVCGLLLDEAPWGEDGETPSFEICDCCGVEFGYEDSTIESIKRYREMWIKSGTKWFNAKKRPSVWSLKEQLKNVLGDAGGPGNP